MNFTVYIDSAKPLISGWYMNNNRLVYWLMLSRYSEVEIIPARI